LKQQNFFIANRFEIIIFVHSPDEIKELLFQKMGVCSYLLAGAAGEK
jgi:hypothetical protein